jgi:hypothetical protein
MLVTRRLVFALVLALAASPALAQQKLKFAHVYETSEPYHTESVWAAAEIKKRTNGKFDIEVFPASTLGKETDINQGLTLGTVDMIYAGSFSRDAATGRSRSAARLSCSATSTTGRSTPSHLSSARSPRAGKASGDNTVDHLLRQPPDYREQGLNRPRT